MLSPIDFLLATGIVAVAAALQAAAGMGMGLVAAPLLALLDTSLAPVPTLISVMTLSAAVACRHRSDVDRSVLPTALFGLIGGCLLGAAVLVMLQEVHLDQVFGALVLLAVGLSMSGLRIPVGRASLLIGGAASGMLGTMSGAHGPPIAIVLQHEPPQRLRPTLCAFFAVGGVISLGALGLGGLLTQEGLLAGLMLQPGVALGLLTAPALSRHVTRGRARWAVLGLSASSATMLLLR